MSFFDMIPDDIHPIIAKFFNGCTDVYITALNYADGSEVRRRAVMEALDYRLIYRERDSGRFSELMKRFGDILQDLSLKNAVKESFVADYPHLPSLRRASILATDQQLAAIMRSPHLSSLDIKLMHSTNWTTLASAFAITSLRTLRLQFERTKHKPSLEQQELLAEALPTLKTLDIPGLSTYKRFWRMIKNLPCLRSLAINSITNNDDEIEFFRTLREVRLHEESSLRNALPIRRKVTKVALSRVQNWHDTLRLSRFPKIRTLQIGLEHGQESGLIGRISNVETLDLGWGFPPVGLLSGHPDADHITNALHYRPKGDFLVRLFHSAPKISRLILTNVVVNSLDLAKVLKIIGPRLVSLSIRMNGQGESEATRLAVVLNCLASCCPNIEMLKLAGPKTDIRVSANEKHLCSVAILRVRRNCKVLSTKRILSYTRGFVTT